MFIFQGGGENTNTSQLLVILFNDQITWIIHSTGPSPEGKKLVYQ